MKQDIFKIEKGRVTFLYLNNVGTLNNDSEPIDMAAPKSFRQCNESGGLRPVENLQGVSSIASEAADTTKQLFNL